MDTMPKCKMCGNDLYEKRQLFYDKRRKYCPACAEWRKRTQDAERMKEKRKAERNARTEKINQLTEKVQLLQDKNEQLNIENNQLRNVIITMRERYGL